jgi:DNA-binding LacI/PurR family transcriptional regulator
MHRVTLKNIAEAAGLSVSCAARALKNRPDISPATCQRVREVAERLGYAPDPMLTALSAYRQARRSPQFRGTLAFVTVSCDERTCLKNRDCGELFRGAKGRAESLGYSLDYFNLAEFRKGRREIGSVLRARGIRGVLLRGFPSAIEEIAFPFDDFTCVSLFSEPHSARVSTVSSMHAQSMELVLAKLRARGFRHPALVIDPLLSQPLHHGWWTTFTVYASQFESASIFTIDEDAPLFSRSTAKRRAAIAKLRRWAAEREVDALVFGSSENRLPTLDELRARKKSPLRQVVSMDLLDPACGVSGIYQNRAQGGAVAVEWLQSLLLTARTGVERSPVAIMIPGSWVEGSDATVVEVKIAAA